MDIRKGLALTAALCLALSAPVPGGSSVIVVDTLSGSDILGCGVAPAAPCNSIGFAYLEVEFNSECDADMVPHACCTGLGTGTCPLTEIRVMPGIYNECPEAWGFGLNPPADNPVRLVASDCIDPDVSCDSTSTTINAAGVCDAASAIPNPAVRIGGTGALLQGFTIQNGGFSGVFARGGVTISNNLIEGSSSAEGGGIYFRSGGCYYAGDEVAEISDNLIRNNQAVAPPSPSQFEESGDGGGIFLFAEGRIQRLNPGPGETECLNDANPTVTVSGNTIENNTLDNQNVNPANNLLYLTFGAGMAAQAFAEDNRSADIVISQNTISGNSMVNDSEGYGGGMWVNTNGYGDTSIEINENTIGDGAARGVSSGNTASLSGGGISAYVQAWGGGNHGLIIDGNTISGNEGTFFDGGGIELRVEALNLITGNGFNVEVTDNDIRQNVSPNGGGMRIFYLSDKSADGSGGTQNANPADQLSFTVANNRITENEADSNGGGVWARIVANADVDRLCAGGEFSGEFCFVDPDCGAGGTCEPNVFNPPANCPQDTGATATIDFSTNYIAENHVVFGQLGAGLLFFPDAVGDAVATINIDQTTIAGNSFDAADAFSGGIEIAGATEPDCDEPAKAGTNALNVQDSVLFGNDAFGISGPPGQNVTITNSSLYGNNGFCFGGASDGTTCDDASQCPGGLCALLTGVCDAGTNANTLCLDDGDCPGGSCDLLNIALQACFGGTNDGSICTSDANCPGGGICSQPDQYDICDTFCVFPDLPAGNLYADPQINPNNFFPSVCSEIYAADAGFLRNPDITANGALDGIDILPTAESFGADPAALRFNGAADLNRDGEVDGEDLVPQTTEFGTICP